MAKNLTPVWNKIAKHAMLQETTHDERARYNFLSNLNKHLAHVAQGTKTAYDTRVVPKFKKEHGRDIKNREELKGAIEQDLITKFGPLYEEVPWKCANKQAAPLF